MYMPQPSIFTHWDYELYETVQANVVMGNVSEVLLRMLSHCGADKELLTSTDVIEVPKYTLTYTNYDKAILRKY